MTHETVGRKMEILLVEDSLPSGRLTLGALRKGNIEHRLTWLRDGAEAVQFLHQEGRFARAPRPDLILLDLRLPGLDGRDVLGEVRGEPKLADIPIVIMTSSVEDRAEIEQTGQTVEAYMVKPVNLEQFLKVVQQLKHFWKADMILPESG